MCVCMCIPTNFIYLCLQTYTESMCTQTHNLYSITGSTSTLPRAEDDSP